MGKFTKEKHSLWTVLFYCLTKGFGVEIKTFR